MARRLDEATRAARHAEITRRIEAGESQRQIAEALGVSRGTVQKELRAMPQRPTPQPGERHRQNAVRVEGTRATAAAVVKNTHGVGAFGNAFQTILPPPDHFSRWRSVDLDRDTWSKVDATELVSLLINISPEMSRAVWDYLRLLNSGHEIRAYVPGTETPSARGQAAVDAFIERLEGYYGSFKIIAGRLFMAAITRGAFFAELVLDETGRVPIDIATPDPATVRFRRHNHPERGEIWMPGQWQDGEFVDFDMPTVRYMALDPEAGNPYGRPMLSPAIFPTVFLLGLLHDLRRVVAQQGYPRTNIIINLERLRATYRDLAMPEFEKKVGELIEGVKTAYARLEPDDAFVNTDAVQVERASGAVDTSVMGGVGALIEATERLATRALKTMPLLMGSTDGTSEANANRQWEIFGEGIAHLQHYAETLLARLLELALQVQGIPATVEVKFGKVRSADALRDEQVMEKRLANAETAERLGYMARDEASEYAVGHEAATEAPEPEPEAQAPQADDVQAEPGDDADETEPGEERYVFVDSFGRRYLPGDTLPAGTTFSVVRATSDDVWADPEDTHIVLDDERMRAAMETWEEAFAGEDIETLLDADVEEGGDE